MAATIGADRQLGIIRKSLLANFTVSTVTKADTNLSFPIGANEVWDIEFFGTVQCSGVGGTKAQVTTPAGATIEGWYDSTGANITTMVRNRITAVNTLTAIASHTVAALPGPDSILVRVKNGATPGTVFISFASVTAAQITTVFAGAFIRAFKSLEV
jgi:hypothetical protein